MAMLLLRLLRVMKMSKIFVIGASGHAKVIIDIIEEIGHSIGGVFDQDINKKRLCGIDVKHDFSDLPKHSVIAIGNNYIRKKIAKDNLFELRSLVHPKSAISKFAEIGDGTVVMAGVSVNADARVGDYCILNTNCSVDHDCKIGDFVHISPNVALAGNVEIGECTHIGIGACVKQGVIIGRDCVVGAGAVVIKDIPDGMTIEGNPGKELKRIK